MPSSKGSSKFTDRTQVSYVAGGFSNTEPPGKPELGLFPFYLDFLGGSAGKESAFNAGDLGSIPGWEIP